MPCMLLLLVHGAGCTRERALPPSTVTRGETSALTLPADPTRLGALLGVPPESLLAAGQERYGRQAYDSARAIWSVELERARANSDSAAQARALMWLGLSSWRLGDYKAARRDGELSLVWKRRLGLDAELSRSYNGLGLLSWNEGRHRNALVAFDSAVAAARRHDDHAGVARAIANIPLVQVELGQYDAAHKGFLAAREAGRRIEDERTQANALANLAMLDIRLGNPAAAIPLLDQARQHYRAIEYATGEANALGQLATALSAQGDLQRGIAAADSGLTIARAQGLQQEAASILEVIADLHLQAGSPRLALRRLREADSVDAVLGLAVEQGNNLRRSAIVLLELGEGAAAAAKAREALSVHQDVEALGEAIQDRLQLALALQQNGSPELARTEIETAVREAARIQNPSVMIDAAQVAAQLALLQGDPRRALRYAGRVPVSTSNNDWRLDDLRAGALLALGRLDEARSVAQRAISSLERERGTLGVGPLRSAYFMSRTGPFSRLIAIHLARQDTAAAFTVAATLPGKVLAERMGGLAGGAGTVKLVAEREGLLLRSAALERELAELPGTSDDVERRRAVQHELDASRAAYEEHLALGATSAIGPLLGLASVTLPVVQSQIEDNEALLLYLAGPGRLDAFLVRRNGVFHHQQDVSADELGVRVRVARELIGRSGGRQVPAPLGELYQMLLEPLARQGALQGAHHLHIVSHGAIAALPVAALWNRSTGRFLVEDFTVNYLPAVAALGGTPPKTSLQLRRMALFAPLSDSLPATGPEVGLIARLLPGATVAVGQAATERGVRAALRAGRPVHVATHGTQNAQNPLFSQVFVGRAGKHEPGDDGRLELHEILTLTTESPLVFLSGCETGFTGAGHDSFAQTTEEGSLAQAFLIAGAKTVVATLWRVPDQGARELAGRFYRHLLSEGVAADALARAQREAIRAGEGLSWAAYSVFGISGRKSRVVVRATGERP